MLTIKTAKLGWNVSTKITKSCLWMWEHRWEGTIVALFVIAMMVSYWTLLQIINGTFTIKVLAIAIILDVLIILASAITQAKLHK